MYLAAILTSSSENASGVQTIQVLGVWSASPVDKLSDNSSCRADIKMKNASKLNRLLSSSQYLCNFIHSLDYLGIENIVSKNEQLAKPWTQQ